MALERPKSLRAANGETGAATLASGYAYGYSGGWIWADFASRLWIQGSTFVQAGIDMVGAAAVTAQCKEA